MPKKKIDTAQRRSLSRTVTCPANLDWLDDTLAKKRLESKNG